MRWLGLSLHAPDPEGNNIYEADADGVTLIERFGAGFIVVKDSNNWWIPDARVLRARFEAPSK